MAKSGDHIYPVAASRSPFTSSHPLLNVHRRQTLSHSLSKAREPSNPLYFLSRTSQLNSSKLFPLQFSAAQRARSLFHHQKYGDNCRQLQKQLFCEGCQLDLNCDHVVVLEQSSLNLDEPSSKNLGSFDRSIELEQLRRRAAVDVFRAGKQLHQLGHHHHFVSYPQR